MMKKQPPIYAYDIETDPFEYGVNIQPFACGLYWIEDGKPKWFWTWGKDCIAEMKAKLDTLPPGIVYAHNGGKFDMFYSQDWFATGTKMFIINKRIVSGQLTHGSNKFHEFRDSYAIMPFPLKKYKKDTVDYRTFTRKDREKNKPNILKYLKQDCVSLHELCVSYWQRFGDFLTVGSTALNELKQLHSFDRLDDRQDARIRAPYYYGGRVQCFEGGIVKASKGEHIVFYDLNQCYPYVMGNMLHPVSAYDNVISNEITDKTYFVTVYGINHNAFPMKTVEGLRFNIEKGIFSVSIHEYRAAIDTGMFECLDVIECLNFSKATTFDKFVNKYHKLRQEAQQNNDDAGSLLYKYVGNSAYGKFAQSPENYHDYTITDEYTNLNPNRDPNGWYPCSTNLITGHIMWSRPTYNRKRFNVATGASITGGARSLIIRALAKAKRPIYCDTDCIVCEHLDVPIHDTKLGAWKVEAHGDMMALAGRKLYALYDGKTCVKTASKGSLLKDTPEAIVRVAKGATVTWKNTRPTFDFATETMSYITRRIRRTV